MRTQITAANWKMNLSYPQAEELIKGLLLHDIPLQPHHQIILAIPFPYLDMASKKVHNLRNIAIAAQNCYYENQGAFTGEVSIPMLASLGVSFVIVGHSERRILFGEDNDCIRKKLLACCNNNIRPIFCCGEPLDIRRQGAEKDFIAQQLKESLFYLSPEQISQTIIAYEPIWAIGTGQTATLEQIEDMHRSIRNQIDAQYGKNIADTISILYGGSVKANNATDIFKQAHVDGGLVGNASLVAQEFISIAQSMKR
ncbi:MAG: triose-phosphate isomerase [Phycisphaerales bacterium]|nr:triose-phosphate isomerase [Phycisphaerales bacterium]